MQIEFQNIYVQVFIIIKDFIFQLMRLILLQMVFIIYAFVVHAQQKQSVADYNKGKSGNMSVQSMISPNSLIDFAKSLVMEEGFDEEWLPENWTKIDFHLTHNWEQSNPGFPELNFNNIDPNSQYSALVPSLAENQDEWLITPQIVVAETPARLNWYAGVSGPWLYLATLRCLISTDNGSNWTELWNAVNHISSNDEWMWHEIEINLDDFAGIPFHIAWNYVGNDGDLAGIDGVQIRTGEDYIYITDFEEYIVGEMVALNDTTGFWSTWNNQPGSFEDAFIIDTHAHSPTRSVLVSDSNNLILRFGERSTGIYKVSARYFIENGNSAFFNIQHFEQPGIEEAFSVVFEYSGAGYINAGVDSVKAFSYPNDTWFLLTTYIDLDNDWTEFFIDDNLVFEWPFHYQSNHDFGTLQLGCINFRTTDPQSDSSGYYFDDVEVIKKHGSLQPLLFISDTVVSIALSDEETYNDTLTIGNLGIKDLKYQNVITYPKEDEIPGLNKDDTKSLNSSQFNQAIDDLILNYDGDNDSAMGNDTTDYEWQIAAMFPAEMIKPMIGMEIYKVDIFINDLPTESTIRIFEMGSLITSQPGELIYEQDFTANPQSWNSVVLDSSIYISGHDIWVGCWLKCSQGSFVPGVDAGPADSNGDWISYGAKWEHLSGVPELNFNWNIRAYLNKDPVTQWLSIDNTEGVVKEFEYTDVISNIDGSELNIGNYNCKVLVRNNDPENEEQAVTFYLNITNSVNNNDLKIRTLVYPNPATDLIFIKSNAIIDEVTLVDINGRKRFSEKVNENNTVINSGSFSSGIYVLQIITKSGKSTIKIIIE